MNLQIILENGREMREALVLGQKNGVRWGRSALARGGRKVVKRFKAEWLSGEPGIKGGQFKKGKHVRSFVNFGPPDDVTVGISRILRVHEEGAPIEPHTARALFLSKKTGKKGRGEIFAVVPRVVIPARTGFRVLVREMAPDIRDSYGGARVRAIQDAFRVKLKRKIGGMG